MAHQEEVKKVSWNASQGIITEVANRRSYANTFFVNGNIKKAFNTLISVKQSVIQSFGQTERNKLKEIEDKFNKCSGFLSSASANSFSKNIRESHSLAIKLATKIYSEYNDKLMDLLNTYGYLIGEQTDASKMKFS